MTQLTLDSLAGGRPKGEFNRALKRLARLHQRGEDIHEVTLKVRIRPAHKRGRKQVSYTVRTGIVGGRNEVAVSSGKASR